MKNLTVILLGGFIITTTISSTVFAGDDGFYIGGDIGNGSPNINTTNGTSKNSSVVGGVELGYKFNKYLGIEAQYTGIGKVTDKVSGIAKGDAASITAIGLLPLNDEFNLYGKLGVAIAKSTVSSNLAPMADATHTAPTYGLGAEYNLNKNIGIRLGWDHYNMAVVDVGSNKINMNANVASLGAVYNF